jgi:sec-independent protein translocase protein TatA
MSIGLWQILFVALLALVLFGGRRLPNLMEDMGKGLKAFRKGLSDEDKPAQSTKPAEPMPTSPATSDTKARPATQPKRHTPKNHHPTTSQNNPAMDANTVLHQTLATGTLAATMGAIDKKESEMQGDPNDHPSEPPEGFVQPDPDGGFEIDG